MEVNVKEILTGFIQHARLSGVGEPESNFLEELVAGFDSNSKEARRAMRKLLAHDNHRFFCSACRILKSGVETAGRDYLMKLLLEGDLLLVCLADPALFSLEMALDLAKDFVHLDPLLDFKLMQLLFRSDRVETGEVDADQAVRVLDLVAALPRHSRIATGERMLLERRCRDGGWNYGNRRVLGADLPSYPETTAMALMALNGHASVQWGAALNQAERMWRETRSPLARAWLAACLLQYRGERPKPAAADSRAANDIVVAAVEAIRWDRILA